MDLSEPTTVKRSLEAERLPCRAYGFATFVTFLRFSDVSGFAKKVKKNTWLGQCWQGGRGDSRDTSTFVTSCPNGMSLPADSYCEGRVSLHFTQSGLSIPTAAGIVVARGSEYILAHTGPRELDGHPLGGCGSGFGLVPGYTTLSVRVRANT